MKLPERDVSHVFFLIKMLVPITRTGSSFLEMEHRLPTEQAGSLVAVELEQVGLFEIGRFLHHVLLVAISKRPVLRQCFQQFKHGAVLRGFRSKIECLTVEFGLHGEQLPQAQIAA